ncbi:MAG: hypothetical protein HWD86_09010 [Kangiellaceae bacterium]|nr:hypothetical protein [Kangiellaceae bacterium]
MRYVVIFLIFFLVPSINAEEFRTEKAKELAKQLKQTVNRTLAEIYKLELSDDSLEQNTYTIQQPEMTQTDLGIVIDPDKRMVLSVTMNSNADKMGFKSGDIINRMMVNGEYFGKSYGQLILYHGDFFSVDIIRDGVELNLEKTIQSIYVPNWELRLSINNEDNLKQQKFTNDLCGRVSVFFTPPETKLLFPAKIQAINGLSGLNIKDTVKLTPGLYEFSLQEAIPSRHMYRRSLGSEKPKKLSLTVEAHKTYHLAAEFIPHNRYKLKEQKYWNPSVWQVSERECYK